MSRFAYDTPPGFAFNSEEIMKIWYGGIISELSEMVVEKIKERWFLGTYRGFVIQ